MEYTKLSHCIYLIQWKYIKNVSHADIFLKCILHWIILKTRKIYISIHIQNLSQVTFSVTFWQILTIINIPSKEQQLKSIQGGNVNIFSFFFYPERLASTKPNFLRKFDCLHLFSIWKSRTIFYIFVVYGNVKSP